MRQVSKKKRQITAVVSIMLVLIGVAILALTDPSALTVMLTKYS